MNVPPGRPQSLASALEALPKSPTLRFSGTIDRPPERRLVGRPQAFHHLERGSAEVRVDRGLLRRGLSTWERGQRDLGVLLATARNAVPGGQAGMGCESKRPRHRVPIGPELGGMKKEIHERTLGSVLGPGRVAKRALTDLPEQGPEGSEHALEGRPVPRGEGCHCEVQSGAFSGLQRTCLLQWESWDLAAKRPDVTAAEL